MAALLPPREAHLDRLAARLLGTDRDPACLIVLGLVRRDDAPVVPQGVRAQVTSLLARSIRGEDWIAGSGAAEFGIVLTGPATSARAAATRLVASVVAQGVPGLSAAAGIAPVDEELSAGEILRRATLSLTAARRVGAGTVILYRDPV